MRVNKFFTASVWPSLLYSDNTIIQLALADLSESLLVCLPSSGEATAKYIVLEKLSSLP